MDKIEALLQKYQPQACIFNSCDTNGTCLSANAIRWIGTESMSPYSVFTFIDPNSLITQAHKHTQPAFPTKKSGPRA